MRADARQSKFSLYLSAILLASLIAHAAFGWWWADPIAGMVMVPLIAKEGLENLTVKT
jgi:divalent metal cation (Fe/Co/Zn/Cd) transporter